MSRVSINLKTTFALFKCVGVGMSLRLIFYAHSRMEVYLEAGVINVCP